MEDPEPQRRVESATFEPVRIGDHGRRRSPLVATAWLVVLGSFVAFAAIGRSTPTSNVAGPLATPILSSTLLETLEPLLGANLRADDPKPFGIKVATTPGGLAVQGTLLGRSITTVSVRVVDVDGASVVARSISVEDPDGGIRPAHQRAFSVVLGLSATQLLTASFVEVDGYDSLGFTVGSALESLATLLGPCGAGRPCGAG